jgi:hypothetical protein
MGSVRVTFKPAPRGIALAVGDVAKPVLKLAGIEDAWAFTAGHTKTTANYATAAFEALKKTSEMRVSTQQEHSMQIRTGMIPGMTPPKKDEEPVTSKGQGRPRRQERPKVQIRPKAEAAKVEEKKEAPAKEEPKAEEKPKAEEGK